MTAESSRTLTPTTPIPLAHPAQPGRHAVDLATSQLLPTTTAESKSTPRRPSTPAPASSARLRLGQPIAVLQNLPRFGRNGRRNARKPDAHTGIGHPDRQTPAPDAWTLDTPRGHRTPDTGHRTPDGRSLAEDADMVTTHGPALDVLGYHAELRSAGTLNCVPCGRSLRCSATMTARQ
jgi:hypothetical protein